MICVLHPGTPDPAIARAIAAGGGGQKVCVITRVNDLELVSCKGVFCHHSFAEQVLALPSIVPVVVMSDHADPQLLELVLRTPRALGVVSAGRTPARRWEFTYLARRMAYPTNPGPELGMVLGWGATSVAFTPRTTRELREIEGRIEDIGTKMGLTRRQATLVAQGAHELMMNAVYDAPRDAEGNPRYALDRTAEIELDPEEVPRLRLTISGDLVALDMEDPNGGLKRRRYFEGVLRGVLNHAGRDAELDTSHGGAGLGLHALYQSSILLRAEVMPSRKTLVSWMMSRDERESDGRSLYFLTDLSREVLDLEAADFH